MVIAWVAKLIAPAASKAPSLVTVNVSVAKEKSLSSTRRPSVLANGTRPDVRLSAVIVEARRSKAPISTFAAAPCIIARF